MTGADLERARQALDMTAADLGRALRLGGRDPGRYVRSWETGAAPVPGPVAVALELMLRLKRRGRAWRPDPQAEPAEPETSGSEPPEPFPAAQPTAAEMDRFPAPSIREKSRRRG
jgi:hypothetical protein